MCIALDSILADKQTHDARNHFGPVFDQLLAARTLTTNPSGKPCQHGEQLATTLNELAHGYQDRLQELPRHDTYSRHIIGTNKNWIGYICRWEPNTISSIHGHPSFAYYQVLYGQIVMDFFEPVSNDEARMVSTREMGSGENIYSVVAEGQFDNLVHRVTTKDATVFSLHLYSDNPAKGRMYKSI